MICQRLRDLEVGLHHGWCLFKGGKETNEQMCHKLLVVVCLRSSICGTLQILLSNQNLIQQKIQYIHDFTYNQEKRFFFPHGF